MGERMEEQMEEIKAEINESQSADLRSQKDLSQIVSDVVRLDELGWGTVGLIIAQLLVGCVNVYAWKRRPFQVEMEALPRPAAAPMLVSSSMQTHPPALRSLNRRSRRSYRESQN